MKTTVSLLGTILLAGAVALAQSSGSSGASSAKKGSSSSSTSSSGAQAGNSGFDATDSSQASPSSSATSSQTGSSSSGSSGSDTKATSSQSGSSSSNSDLISNGPVAETVSDSSALIGWATRSAASNTGVKYGTVRANLTETAQGTDGSDGKNHHVRLQGLSPSTRYYFQITENGQPVGGVGTFKTTASGETPVQSKAIVPQK